MPRALLAFTLFLSACCRVCGDCPPEAHDCPEVFEPSDAGMIVDSADAGTQLDAGLDAMARPDEPVNMQCVAPRGDGDSSCSDPYEPNGDMITARTSSAHECDVTEKDAKVDDDDVDVFRTGECSVGLLPYASLGPLTPWSELAGDARTLRLCIFPTCSTGSTNVYACYETPSGVDMQGDTPSVPSDLFNSQVGFRGCCRTGPGRITAKIECPRHSNAIDTYVWVDAAMRDGGCHAYTLRYKMK
ncbi:MAG TPA: hypothetical protein VF469_31640 [Kofleriaceae bacterium]